MKQGANHTRICRKVHVLHPFTPEEEKAIKDLTRFAVLSHSRESLFYLRLGDALVDKIDQGGGNWDYISGYEKAIFKLAILGNMEDAWKLYRELVVELTSKYWSDCDNADLVAGLKARELEISALSAPNN